MRVPFNYLQSQFKNYKLYFKEWKKLIKSSEFTLGPFVQKFENNFANFIGAKHCIATNNGTDALILSLKAQGIEKGDEIITTPFTYFATIEAIIHVGAKPVFIDINPHTFNLNYKKIEDAITKKTKGVLLVHIFGQPCNMDEIKRVCSNIKLS